MGTGYTRNDTTNNIADGNIIDAADLDGEFDAIQSAFNASTGHTHDGTSAEGAPITVTGPAQEYVSSATEFRPKTNNTYDLGSLALQWKNLYVDGIAYLDSVDIDGGSIDGTAIGASTAAAGSFTTLISNNATVNGNITVTGTVDGRDVAADGTKLDGIEAGATADQTAAEIRALVEAATDSNVFTDADHNKLNGIEASADVTDTANVTAAGALMDSELTNITAVKALNQGVATTDSPTFAGGTLTGNLSFGDNDRAIFGAGSDLQIYHSGTDSVIHDFGTGNFRILADDFKVENAQATATLIYADAPSGAVSLYNGNAVKLATTATGVDVTGTVTADGLTVNAATTTAATFSRNGALETIVETLNSGSVSSVSLKSPTNKWSIANQATSRDFDVTDDLVKRMSISHATGDISFYEDTGTTPKFFWDASTERLGIGTSSPSAPLDVRAAASGSVQAIIGNATETTQLEFVVTGNDKVELDVTDGGNNRNLAFSISGTERMRIDSSGRVGIGTSSPTKKLELGLLDAFRMQTGSVAMDCTPTAGAIDSFVWNTSANAHYIWSISGTERMRIDSSGRVGIGTNSPNHILDVQGAGGTQVLYNTNATSNGSHDAKVLAYSSGTSIWNNLILDSATHKFNVFGTERLRINSDGNVGIGTTSPTDKLNISSSSNQIGLDTGDQATYGTLDLGHFDNGAFIGTYAGTNSASNVLRLGTSGTERMRIDSSGNVGIGTVDPKAPLDVINGATRRYLFRDGRIDAVNTGNTAWERLTLRGNGWALDDATGQGRFSYEPSITRLLCTGSASRGATGYVVTTPNDSIASLRRLSGYVEMQTDIGAIGVTYFTSDERKKENIVPATKLSSEVINAINFISFDWKPDSGNTGHVEVGVSAQQLQTVDDRLVNTLSDDSLMVNEPALVAHMAKALQEALGRIETLEAEVAALKGV